MQSALADPYAVKQYLLDTSPVEQCMTGLSPAVTQWLNKPILKARTPELTGHVKYYLGK